MLLKLDKYVDIEYFRKEHYEKNQPALIGEWLVEDWPIFHQLNLERFHNDTVMVVNCNDTDCEPVKMKLKEFIEKQDNKEPLYVKDWHLFRDHPDVVLYHTPALFQDDWLNDYCLARTESDFRFVYYGLNGSKSFLHADVFRSYSWSTNITGIKRWLLYPPHCEELLKDKWGSLILDPDNVDHDQFPRFKEAKQYELEVYQYPKQTIFVPSNWFHSVYNYGPTLSINHNFFNRHNISDVLNYFEKCLKDVQKEHEDLLEPPVSLDRQEWLEICQRTQKLHFGLDSSELKEILTFRLGSSDCSELDRTEASAAIRKIETLQKL